MKTVHGPRSVFLDFEKAFDKGWIFSLKCDEITQKFMYKFYIIINNNDANWVDIAQ